MSSEPRRRASQLARWASLVAGAISLAACLGGVDRIYATDSGADAGSTTGGDATMDAPPQTEGGTDGGRTPDADAMIAQETAPAETGPPADAPADVATGQTFSCNGKMVTSCANCMNNPIECVYCANDGGHPGVCGPQGQYCTNSAPSGASVCNCPGGNVAQCPAPFQVCSFVVNAYYCQSCGEMGSNMETCKDGGRCSDTTLTCN